MLLLLLLLPSPSPSPLEHLIGKLDQTHLHNGTNVIKRGEKKRREGKMQTEAGSFVGECTLTDHLQQPKEEERRL